MLLSTFLIEHGMGSQLGYAVVVWAFDAGELHSVVDGLQAGNVSLPFGESDTRPVSASREWGCIGTHKKPVISIQPVTLPTGRSTG